MKHMIRYRNMRRPDGSVPSAKLPPITDPERLHRLGLSSEEAAMRRVLGYWNEPVRSASRSIRQILLKNLFTYYNLVFTVLAALLIAVGSFRDLTFMGVVLTNIIIGVVQEIRSKKKLDALRLITAPRIEVLRDGELCSLSAEELVTDDMIQLKAGIQIPADAQVTDGTINVNEALITGEPDEIRKQQGDTLLSGSVVISGTCRARLTHVGRQSYVSKLTRQATSAQKVEQSGIIRSLNRLVVTVGILIIPIGIILFTQQYVMGEGLRSSVVAMVAAVLGMIPEGLYLLASVTMAVSAFRLASDQVLIHNMKCIEALARVDVLCVDKTGTITESAMQTEQLIPADGVDASLLDCLLCTLTQHMDADNATMKALQQYFTRSSVGVPEKIFSFSSEHKYCGMHFDGNSYVLGAPEFILQEKYDQFSAALEDFSVQGFRILAFARYPEPLTGQKLDKPSDPLGFILLRNPVRKQAADTFSYFADNGVTVKVISGDHPAAVSTIAAQAHIPGAEKYIDVSSLGSADELERAVSEYTVFGRVTPEQKQTMIRILKQQGHIVGMTGDGINDVLALREADCSIAMASGSDAAAQIAQLVLLESDFSRMPAVVAEGRRVVNNIQRSAGLFLTKNIFSFLLALFSLASFFTYPLQPAQISLISMFTIGIPAFLLALEPNYDRIQGAFLPNVLRKALPAGIASFLCAMFLVVYGDQLHLSDGTISTICTLLVSFTGFMVLFQISTPLNLRRVLIFTGMLAGWATCILVLHQLFSIEPLAFAHHLLTLLLCVASVTVYRVTSFITDRVWKLVCMHLRRFAARKESQHP